MHNLHNIQLSTDSLQALST